MNHVSLMGRLTRDPELRIGQGENAVAVCRYTLAVQRQKKDDDPNYITIKAFGKRGEFAAQYFKKGMRVVVEGEISTGSYEAKDGHKVNTFDIIASNQEFADGRQDQAQVATKAPADTFKVVPTEDMDDDMPF